MYRSIWSFFLGISLIFSLCVLSCQSPPDTQRARMRKTIWQDDSLRTTKALEKLQRETDSVNRLDTLMDTLNVPAPTGNP